MSNKIELERHEYSLIEQLAARGLSEATIADHLLVSERSWRAIKQRDPEAVAALERGRAIEHDELVGHVLAAARAGSLIAAFFLLKTRHGYNDRGGNVAAAQVNVSITLPDAMSAEDYTRSIDVRATEVAGDE